MRREHFLAAFLVAASASVASADQIIYDGFEYNATGSPPLGTGPLGTAGTFGNWVYQGNNLVEPRVTSGSLSYTGTPASLGNKVTLDTTTPTGADASRLYIGTRDNVATPTLYYSFVTSIPSSTSNNQNGAYFAGFDNLTASTYTTFAGLFVRQNTGETTNVDLGISTSGSANKAWTTALPHDTPLYVVASFNFQGKSTLDVFTDPTAVPVTEPGAHAVTSTANDASAVASVSNFYLRGNSGQPNAIKVDELRIGTSWTDVAAHAYHWDVSGASPGPGGTTPAGAWDGTTQNFNSDATGGGSGSFVAAPSQADSVDFSAGGTATGTYAVSVSGTRSAGTVNVRQGNVTFTGGTLAVGAFNVDAGAIAVVSSDVTGNARGSVTKRGAGTLTFNGNNAYTGGTNVREGTLQVTKLHANNPVSIASGATLRVLDSSPTLPLHPAGDNAFVSQPSSLTIAAGGTLDLTNNDLILSYPDGSTLPQTIEALVRTAYAEGAWSGPGITSSLAALDSAYTIAVADNATFADPFGPGKPFAGVEVGLNSVLVKFTHRVDIDMDGKVTDNDAATFSANYNAGQPAYWAIGDVDYDGVFTDNDAAVFAANYNDALASLPEPASVGLFGLAVLGLARRRKQTV